MSLPQQEAFAHVVTSLDGNVKTNKKCVITIDLGTTFSAAGYVYTSNPSVINIGAPGLEASRDSVKVPTVLLQTSNGWLFGNEALETYMDMVEEAHDSEYTSETENASDLLSQRGIHLYRFFKLKLKNQESGVETLMAKSTSGHQHKLIDLMTHSLEALSKFAMKEIKAGFGDALGITKDDILWVLTVPAIWNDFGKAFMRKAAFRAGLVSDEASDNLLLALEPESASIAVHQEGYKLGLFMDGTVFLVLDCGGGTVDITIHRVATVDPLVLDEEALPCGGAWGGIFVDRQFTGVFLKKFLGEKMLRLIEKRFPHELDEINEQFRLLKEGFVPGRKGKNRNRIRFANLLQDDIRANLGLSNLSRLVEDYNINTGTNEFDPKDTKICRDSILTFSDEQMLAFFEPTVTKICDCVKGILERNMEVSAIVMVGGYGASVALRERVKSVFEAAPYNKTIVVPDSGVRPQAAVVHGAALFGLYTSVIGIRIAKKTYGIATSQKWYKGCGFDESSAAWDSELSEMRVNDIFAAITKREARIKPGETFKKGPYKPIYRNQRAVTFKVFQSNLYSPKLTTSGCEKLGEITVPCQSIDDEFDVHFTFGTDVRVEIVRQDGDRHFTNIEID